MSDLVRCPWVTDDQTYRDYHDNEWGEELRGQRELYEKITLEGFQAGLSWLTILKRRESFRLAFDGFDIQKIAAYGPQKIESLMADPGIIRNRLKILAAINNANVILDQQLDLTDLLWSFAPPQSPGTNQASNTTSPESDAMSKELKRLGFRFVGSTTLFALMQSTGMVRAHSNNCFKAS